MGSGSIADMERYQLLQSLINKYQFKNYLEIGVRDGNVFFAIDCKNKIAVDPNFDFSLKEYVKMGFSLLTGSKFYQINSDDFFAKEAHRLFADNPIDIVLVDGMHEFHFALNDILNSLKFLSENGFIIVHDCNPLTADSACSFKEWETRNFQGVWNGDVWKAIYFLRSTRSDLNIFVADCDHGLGVIRKSQGDKQPINFDLTIELVDKLTFDDLNIYRESFLNLKDASFLNQLLN
jgi:hypothetical protein